MRKRENKIAKCSFLYKRVSCFAQTHFSPVFKIWITRLSEARIKEMAPAKAASSSYTAIAVICADDLCLGEPSRVLESTNWQRVSVSEFTLGRR